MNRLKVADRELRDYLGRDTEGLKYLDALIRVANEQRTRCAALELSEAEARASAERAYKARDDAQQQLEQQRAECAREITRRMASEAREVLLTEQLAALQPPAEPLTMRGTGFLEAVAQLIKNVRARFKEVPIRDGDEYNALYVDGLLISFRSREFESLGMIVAACAYMGFPLRVKSDYVIWKGMQGPIRDEAVKDFIQWFDKRMPARVPLTDLVAMPDNVDAPSTHVTFNMDEKPDEETVERYRDLAIKRIKFVRDREDTPVLLSERVERTQAECLPPGEQTNEQAESSDGSTS